MKNIIYCLLLFASMLNVSQLMSNCTNGRCPYSTIDCSQCCRAGRSVSAECCAACNNCCMYNDESCAECKDYPWKR
jgi:hypothetical protein